MNKTSTQNINQKGPNQKPSIIFVYNADSGLINTVKDYFHKIVKPSTYQCNLCALTFDNLGMKKEWKVFIDELDVEVEFLHKDEFFKNYDLKNIKFPSGFIKRGSNLKLFMDHNEINRCKALGELIELVKSKLDNI